MPAPDLLTVVTVAVIVLVVILCFPCPRSSGGTSTARLSLGNRHPVESAEMFGQVIAAREAICAFTRASRPRTVKEIGLVLCPMMPRYVGLAAEGPLRIAVVVKAVRMSAEGALFGVVVGGGSGGGRC